MPPYTCIILFSLLISLSPLIRASLNPTLPHQQPNPEAVFKKCRALLLSPKPHEATKILHEEKQELIQSREKGPVLSSKPNPPHPTSTSNNKVSTTSRKNFAGHAMPPRKMVPFGRVTKP